MTALLEAREVVRRFGRGRAQVTAVDRVSCALEPGRTLGVVGQSGSGKSTLGEVLGGLQPADGGAVLFGGADVRGLDRSGRRAWRRAVQFVFQDPQASMDPRYTVERVVREPLDMLEPDCPRAERAARVADMLARVGLGPEVLSKRPGQLSGGQCQRVAIARALVSRPSVVVCDECTSALDVSVQAQTLNLLRDLQRDLGTAYLFISHDIAVVGYMADDLLVMNAGRVREEGPADRVLAAPRDPYTRALVDAAAKEA